MGPLEMVVTAEETRNRIPVLRLAVAVVAQAGPEAMVQLAQAVGSESQIPMQPVAASSMEPEVAAHVETLELEEQVDQALVVAVALIQLDLRRLLIQEVVAVAVEPQVQPLGLAALAPTDLL
jgi:hypothetical protein